MASHAVRVHPELALAIYAEALVAQSVVAILGDASTGMGELVLALGARAAYVWDPDASRASEQAANAPPGVTVRSLPYGDTSAFGDAYGARRAGRDFDLVLVPDLGILGDPAVALADARRMVGEDGVLLVGAANAEVSASSGARAFDYYELFDLVAREFESVRMIAQLPFRGVTLAELSDEEGPAAAVAGVSVDTQLGDDTTPTFFFALASQRDVRLDPYAIVQLPSDADEIEEAGEEAAAPGLDASLMRELRERADMAAELEAALQERSRQGAMLAAQLESAQAEVQAVKLQGAEELDELIARVDRAEKRATALEEERTVADSHAADHERLEGVLKERARVVRELEEELARRDRLVRDLAGALEEAHGAPTESAAQPSSSSAETTLRDRLDALALDLARREADARAADWTISELERRLAIAEQGGTSRPAPPAPPVEGGDVGAKLSAALDELDALRKALVQEHEARLGAEARAGGSLGTEGATESARQDAPGESSTGSSAREGRHETRHEHEEGRQGT
jgi:hypothetical protein